MQESATSTLSSLLVFLIFYHSLDLLYFLSLSMSHFRLIFTQRLSTSISLCLSLSLSLSLSFSLSRFLSLCLSHSLSFSFPLSFPLSLSIYLYLSLSLTLSHSLALSLTLSLDLFEFPVGWIRSARHFSLLLWIFASSELQLIMI